MSVLIRTQVLELVLRGYLQTRGAFFTLADVELCTRNLARVTTGPYPEDAPATQQTLLFNQLPAGF